ncbi:hypothetical protein DWY25_17375 [Holdemania filiformis]|uniref:Zona occludens toxin N-terminal domain-containing protein n=1 Tax=Holdemania filiformis TaxID=61171 RepID=A0A412FFK9_9FIRM|nr:ATP-binding protein [Holdemania filiformis]RGR66886.1 hypothetical protein DWY25_17375 [Holdemania filiformis]
MGMDTQAPKVPFHPLQQFKDYLMYKIDFARNNPTYFWADGLCIFVGPQGSGKTLSAVNYVYSLMERYPKCKLVTNLMLKDYPIVTYDQWLKQFNLAISQRYFNGSMRWLDHAYLYDLYRRTNRVFAFDNADDLTRYENETEGVIYLIDEIHLYFNSLESKNINLESMVQFAQQRKQRKHIVCTSQVFGRMAKPLRQQFSDVVVCKNIMGCIQYNLLVDRDNTDESTDDSHVSGTVRKKYMFIHTPQMYKRYDTYYTISRTKFISNELRKGDIYDHDRDISINTGGN